MNAETLARDLQARFPFLGRSNVEAVTLSLNDWLAIARAMIEQHDSIVLGMAHIIARAKSVNVNCRARVEHLENDVDAKAGAIRRLQEQNTHLRYEMSRLRRELPSAPVPPLVVSDPTY